MLAANFKLFSKIAEEFFAFGLRVEETSIFSFEILMVVERDQLLLQNRRCLHRRKNAGNLAMNLKACLLMMT
ncbi:hypothetical protein [Rhizobium alvei]|uniref:hypothetical protein n=1 Tax=Rhizobium alvei TaxID=1132659 RepID=UPI00361625EE